GAVSLWRSLGPDWFASTPRAAPAGARPVVLDVDGDTHQDLLWYEAGRSAHEVWVSTADLTSTTAVASLPPDRTVAVGDFDGDGIDDLALAGPDGTRIW